LTIVSPRPDPNIELAGSAGEFLLRGVRRIAASIVLIVLLVAPAQAQVKMEGSQEALHLEVTDARLTDVLNALKGKFNVRYRSNDALEGRITGSFNGPLRRVVARLLGGYDYVIAISPDGLDALILLQNSTANVVLPQAAPVPTPAPVATAQEASRNERARSR
jgi:hypothetical protein